ncbi:MAG: ribonuclease III [Myxococcales bacterium]|nr:ribonuclease III [Myxococcales bacterium]
MTARTDYEVLEEVLGHRFANRALLERALRHASWRNEHGDDSPQSEDNERLEFLGDAVLDLIVGHRLMVRYPELREGPLSVTRAQVVSEAGLSEVAQMLGLGAWLLLGKGEDRSGGRDKASVLADAFEAVVAAVYLDGSFSAAWDLVGRLLNHRIESVEFKGFYDFKTRLQELTQARLKATPTYRVVDESGPDHDKRFEVVVEIEERQWGQAVGRSKKEAEQMAAANAHFHIEGTDLRPVLREARTRRRERAKSGADDE